MNYRDSALQTPSQCEQTSRIRLWILMALLVFSHSMGYAQSKIAAGYGHSLRLNSDGTVWAWGDNSYGQLGDGTVTQHLTPNPVTGLSPAIRSDFDQNGCTDLLWQFDTTRSAGAWLLGGQGCTDTLAEIWPAPGSYPGWTLVTAADFDGNGCPDLVWQNDATRSVGLWYMGGAQCTSQLGLGWPAPDSYPGWTLVGAADFDGNGCPDLIWQNDASRSVGLWYLGGAQCTTLLGLGWPAPDSYPGWTVVGTADFDGNGCPDLIWQNNASRSVGLWYLGGVQCTTPLGIGWPAPDNYPGWTLVGTADLDHNGCPDLVWQNDATRAVGAWLMTGPQCTSFLGISWLAPDSYPGWRAIAIK
jgi:hypothetical protein